MPCTSFCQCSFLSPCAILEFSDDILSIIATNEIGYFGCWCSWVWMDRTENNNLNLSYLKVISYNLYVAPLLHVDFFNWRLNFRFFWSNFRFFDQIVDSGLWSLKHLFPINKTSSVSGDPEQTWFLAVRALVLWLHVALM